ncbi:protein kinase [Hoyosella sp. YIM 151337]|uniref:serine/threonine-protein kinase n=1 Tax=Hoyosella sp. YIM 151337 TaxID=2992742 RepID=UPI002235D251|nr:serine/threonine-protein kinase [Hoyosella sp. YIM 151337]MCW4355242.1 protein kinase [Hoyosella sp. YIM 151337]
MVDVDPEVTQRNLAAHIPDELTAAGFSDVHVIARGGFGVVYRCNQPALDRVVAVKVLSVDGSPDNIDRFMREQRVMGKLSGHPNIVDVLHVGKTGSGHLYLVMPYHPRGSLDTLIHRNGPFEWREAIRIGIKIAGALETAHNVGVLHRDVKPGNILITSYGEPQLTDFGIARVSGGFTTTAGLLMGSPAFTAPETLTSDTASVAADIYSLGATIFCAVTGHAAFERREGERVIAQFVRMTTQRLPDLRDEGVPPEVCAAIETAMERDPSARPASAAAFGELLRDVQLRLGIDPDNMAIPDQSVRTRRAFSAVGEATMSQTAPQRTPAPSSRHTPPAPAPATRFRPPSPGRPLVHRQRLISQLMSAKRYRLTVIHAPTGFGKSTLAAQWGQQLADNGVPVAWLTVDSDDNNVVWFLEHLIEALRRVQPELAQELTQVLQEHGDEAERYVLTSLINEIHERGQHTVLIIDDWHRVTAQVSIEAMEFLIDHGCHHLQIVVTTRTQTGLPVGRMRVQDELVEIDAASLRFGNDEARKLLVDHGKLPLSSAEVDELTRSTDGWVAALQLASISLRGQSNTSELIHHITGRHYAIEEFLAENVISRLEPRMLEFLMCASTTEKTCGSLASALANVQTGQLLLEEAEERELFVNRVDEQREWFRFHTMFAEFLQRRLEREQPDRLPQLHRTASRWFAAHHSLGDAVDHALAARDTNEAAKLIEKDGMRLIELSQVGSLAALLAKLPPGEVHATARLQLIMAWTNVLLVKVPEALALLARLQTMLASDSLPEDENDQIRVEADVARSVIRCLTDHFDKVDGLVETCLAQPERFSAWLVASAANAATFAAGARFDVAEARRLQEWAQPFHERARGGHSMIYGAAALGIAEFEALNVDAAEQSFRRSVEAVKRIAGMNKHAARLPAALLGRLLYERDQMDEAEFFITESQLVSARAGMADFRYARFGTGARIMANYGDLAAAAEFISDGIESADSDALPRLRVGLEYEAMLLGLDAPAGFVPVAFDARKRPVTLRDARLLQLREACAILLLSRADAAPARELACQWADEWVSIMAEFPHPRGQLIAKQLLAQCLWAAGKRDQAVRAVMPVLAQCEQARMPRFVVDAGDDIAELLLHVEREMTASAESVAWPPVSAAFLTRVLRLSQERSR